MAPLPYKRTFSFTGSVSANPTFVPAAFGVGVDAELDQIGAVIVATETSLGLIQRADGALANGIVTLDSMATGLLATFQGYVAASAASATQAAASNTSAANNASTANSAATVAVAEATLATNSANTAGANAVQTGKDVASTGQNVAAAQSAQVGAAAASAAAGTARDQAVAANNAAQTAEQQAQAYASQIAASVSTAASQANQATTAAQGATVSANTASAGASTAVAARQSAVAWATQATGQVNDGINPAGYSAYYWSLQAQSSATATTIPNGSVTTAKLANGAVTSAILASGAAVANIGNGSLTAALLAGGAALANIGSAGVTSTYLAAGTALVNLVDGTVPASKLTNASVGTQQIANAAITAALLAPGAVGTAALAAGAAAANIGAAGATTSLLAAGPHLLSLPNGNFEDGLAGWRYTLASSTSNTVTIDNTKANVLSGTNSVKMFCPDKANPTDLISSRFPVTEGVPVNVTLVYLSNTTTTGGLFLYPNWFDASGSSISQPGVIPANGGALTSAWQTTTTILTPPPGARYCVLYVVVTGQVATVWIDEVKVRRTPLASDGLYYPAVFPNYGRAMSAKFDDNKHIVDFGAIGDGGSHPLSTRYATLAAAQAAYPFATALTQEIDWAALQAGHNWLLANGGGKLDLGDRQLYVGADTVSITKMQYSQIVGSGIDKCKIIGSGMSNDILYYGSDIYGCYYNHWEGFTVTSTVTRTGGAHIHWVQEKHSMVTRVKTTRHFNGMQFDAFECMCLIDFYIVDPSGAGTSLVIGAQSSSPPTGSNFNMFTGLLRGGSDQGAPPPVGNYGIIINDADAIFAFNLDVGGFIRNDALVQPSTRNYNNFWNSCYFDATGSGDCFAMGGNGLKAEHTFNGCWFASSGQAVAAGSTASKSDTVGLRFLSGGSYSDIKCVGCVFYNNSGAGVLVETSSADINMSGCSFTANGNNAVNWGHQLMIYPSGGQAAPMILNALKFNGTNAAGYDILTGPNAYGNVASACSFITGILQSTYTLYAFKRVQASDDTANTGNLAAKYTVASNTTIHVPQYKDWMEVTGTTTITGIDATWPGHTVSLHLNSALTIRNQVQNLHLNGGADVNLPAGAVITLRCNHNYQWFEIGRTATTG